MQVGGTYFMYLHIDSGNDVDEENENDQDNIHVFSFKYICTGRVAYLNLVQAKIEVP